jgi:hypothetical protein
VSLIFGGFFKAITFLRSWIPILAAPRHFDNGVFLFRKTFSAENFGGVIVCCVIATVSAESLLLFVFFFHFEALLVGVFLNTLSCLRLKLLPNRSMTEAAIIGKTIIASPITIVLSAFFFTLPQLIVSSNVEPDSPPVS